MYPLVQSLPATLRFCWTAFLRKTYLFLFPFSCHFLWDAGQSPCMLSNTLVLVLSYLMPFLNSFPSPVNADACDHTTEFHVGLAWPFTSSGQLSNSQPVWPHVLFCFVFLILTELSWGFHLRTFLSFSIDETKNPWQDHDLFDMVTSSGLPTISNNISFLSFHSLVGGENESIPSILESINWLPHITYMHWIILYCVNVHVSNAN